MLSAMADIGTKNMSQLKITMPKVKRVLYGVNPEWEKMPIANLPENTIKVRRRFRQKDFAKAYIKTQTSIQEWILGPEDGCNRLTGPLKLVVLNGINS